MNALVKIEKPSRAATQEGLLNQLHKADSNHAVFKSYGSTPCEVYNVPEGYVEILHIEGQPDQDISGRLALQLVDVYRSDTQLAYISPDKSKRNIYAPHGVPIGSAIFGNPTHGQPLFVCSQLVAAFKLSHTKLACLLALTDSPAGNLVEVVKDWRSNGYTHIFIPVAVHEAEKYKRLFQGLDVHVLSLPSDIHEEDDPHELERGLLAFVAATDREQVAPVSWDKISVMPLQDREQFEYPTSAFPLFASKAIKAIAKHGQMPEALAGQCALGAMSLVAQSQVNAPSHYNKDGMPCGIYALTSVESGIGKTLAREVTNKVTIQNEKKAMEAYRSDIACYEATLESKNPSDRAAYVMDNPRPINPKKFYVDATVESIVSAMINGSPEATIDTDEAAQFFGGHTMRSEASTAALGIFTKAWDGGPIDRARSKSNENGSGEAWIVRLTISLAGQPDVLNKVLNDQIMKGQGFLARFLFSFPNTEFLIGNRLITVESLKKKLYEDEAIIEYWQRFEKLYDKVDSSDVPKVITAESQKRPVMQMNSAALNLWVEHYNRVEIESKKGGDYDFIRPFARRSGEIALRVATIFAYFEDKAEIDEVTMQGAIDIVNYSLNEWIRYYEISVVEHDVENAKKLESWLIKHCKKTSSTFVTVRDASRFAIPKLLRKKVAMQSALNILADRGIVQHTSVSIFLHPSLIC